MVDILQKIGASISSNKFNSIKRGDQMLLVQKVNDDSSEISLIILHRVFPNMKALEKNMKEHPENFNEDYEYSLVDPRPFVKVTYAKFPILETTNPFEKIVEEK